MRILFIGTVTFSLHALERLLDLNANVVGLITKKASDFNSDYSDLSLIADRGKIPVFFTNDVNSREVLNWVQDLKPDVAFCFGWSNLLKRDFLNIPSLGVIGYHPAALPMNRGRHPLVWALALGLKETASTFFFMNEGADSGPILDQAMITIDAEENAGSLYDKMTNTALVQIERFFPKVVNRTYTTTGQDESKANYWRKRGKNDGRIDWRMGATAIVNLVRALTKPYVGAHLEYKSNDVKIWKVKKVEFEGKNIEPGKILKSDADSIVVKCYDGAIEILVHEFEILPKQNEYLL